MLTARAYVIDGTNGTRSGPVRDSSDKETLERDRQHLLGHAQPNERSSGTADPGHTHWTDLPMDRVFEVLNQEVARQQREMHEQQQAARQPQLRAQRERQERERRHERMERDIQRLDTRELDRSTGSARQMNEIPGGIESGALHEGTIGPRGCPGYLHLRAF